jgi:hypothetical protein
MHRKLPHFASIQGFSNNVTTVAITNFFTITYHSSVCTWKKDFSNRDEDERVFNHFAKAYPPT